MRKHLRKPREKVLRRQSTGAIIAELLDRQQLPRHDDFFVVNGKIDHPHRHRDQCIQRIRHGWEVLRRAEALVIVGDHSIQQRIPDGLFVLEMLINR